MRVHKALVREAAHERAQCNDEAASAAAAASNLDPMGLVDARRFASEPVPYSPAHTAFSDAPNMEEIHARCDRLVRAARSATRDAQLRRSRLLAAERVPAYVLEQLDELLTVCRACEGDAMRFATTLPA